MSKVRSLMLVGAAALGFAAVATDAEAQYYYPQQHYYYPQRGYYDRPPVYVPPRVQRKQRQLEQRFIEKYGYVQPAPRYRPQRPVYPQRPYYQGNPYVAPQPYPYGQVYGPGTGTQSKTWTRSTPQDFQR